MDSDKRHDQLWSRRGVVKGAAGAAAVGAVTLASPRTAQAETASATARRGRTGRAGAAASAAVPNQNVHPMAGETMTVHVRDARTGQLDIYVGERHVQVRDRDLAARLIAAAR